MWQFNTHLRTQTQPNTHPGIGKNKSRRCCYYLGWTIYKFLYDIILAKVYVAVWSGRGIKGRLRNLKRCKSAQNSKLEWAKDIPLLQMQKATISRWQQKHTPEKLQDLHPTRASTKSNPGSSSRSPGRITNQSTSPQKNWFPGINRLVEKIIERCFPCQASTNSQIKELVITSPMPSAPWSQLSMDYTLPTDEQVFGIIYDYLRYPYIHFIKSTSSWNTISRLEHIFTQHGIPMLIWSDNGPPSGQQHRNCHVYGENRHTSS